MNWSRFPGSEQQQQTVYVGLGLIRRAFLNRRRADLPTSQSCLPPASQGRHATQHVLLPSFTSDNSNLPCRRIETTTLASNDIFTLVSIHDCFRASISTRSKQDKRPKKFAGQAPPDEAFYASSFKSDQIGRQSLVRGLHIDNHEARLINIFIDDQLRQDSPHRIEDATASDDEDGAEEAGEERTRAAKFFELDLGKKTHFSYDVIYTALIKEFECFRDSWREEHEIPWTWHTSAVRIWVRNNRTAMAREPRLQEKPGVYKRKYAEKREIHHGPTQRAKKSKRRWKLIDQKIVIFLCQRVPQDEMADPAASADGKTSIKPDPDGEQIVLPTWELVSGFGMSEPDNEILYLENGDLNPEAFEFDKLLTQCEKLGDTGESAILAYSKGDRMTKIRDDKGLVKAIKFLHETCEREWSLELMFVGASGVKKEPEQKGEATGGGPADKEDREPAEGGRAGNRVLELD